MHKPITTLLLTALLCIASILILCETQMNSQFSGNVTAASETWPMFQHDASHSGSTFAAQTQNTIQWSYQTNGSPGKSLIVAGGMVHVSTSWALYAINPSTGGFIRYYRISCGSSSPCYANSKNYVGSDDGNVYAFDAVMGTKLWNYTTGAVVLSSPATDGSVVYVGSMDANLYALSASTGAKIWNFTTGAQIHSSPGLSDGKVYVGSDDGKVYAFDASTGAQAWNYKLSDGPVYSDPSVTSGIVYIGSYNGTVYALNASTGAKVWSYQTGTYPLMYADMQRASVTSCPAVVGGIVYVTSEDGYVYALNALTGSEIWHFQTSGIWLDSSPAITNGVVYVECSGFAVNHSDQQLYALDASTGKQIQTWSIGGTCSAALYDGTVYVASNNGTIYAFPIVNAPVATPTPAPTNTQTSQTTTSNPTVTQTPKQTSNPTGTPTSTSTSAPTPTTTHTETNDTTTESTGNPYTSVVLPIGLVAGVAILAVATVVVKKTIKH
jgi:outer membrane protein assembly factor BamB